MSGEGDMSHDDTSHTALKILPPAVHFSIDTHPTRA